MLDWMLAPVLLVGAAAITLWMAGAIYFDVCGGGWRGRVLAGAWIVGVVMLFVFREPLWQPFVVLVVVLGVFLVGWFRQRPRHDRDWEPAVAVLARALREDDRVTIENVRNFDYPGPDQYTPRYGTRTYHLANLHAADVIFFTWGSPWMSHPVLVFDFGADGRLCVSIEVRYRKGQDFSLLRSLYRQQELIFTVADERDIILRRTKFSRNQQAHLYRFTVSVEEVRDVFAGYVAGIQSLYVRPRWYHGLCANCTTTFYRLPGRECRCDWRVLANGRLDQALYEAGLLDNSLPFAELRQLAYLNDIANAAPEVGFGDHIRQELERRRHGR